MMTQNQSKNISNISANYGFLYSLVSWVLAKYTDPSYLSNIIILLPSRRACREIKKIFLHSAANEALILPKILAIGDVDYDLVLPDAAFENLPDVFDAENRLKYKLRLIDEIKNWNRKTNLFGQNISTAALAEIADHLQSFLDEVEKEGLNTQDLIEVDDSELASHKQQILQFLRYFGSEWQNLMAKEGLISISHRRNLMIKNYEKHLRENGSRYPIIAAGSTGSVLATAELLKTIAGLENGHLVLFGLDCELDENIWNKIGENHPQFLLKKLLEKIGVSRKEVEEIRIEEFRNSDDFIPTLSSLVMLPAEFCDLWQTTSSLQDFSGLPRHFVPRNDGVESLAQEAQDRHCEERAQPATRQSRDYKKNPQQSPTLPTTSSNITKIETESEHDQARLIAIMMRMALEEPGKTAALISNDQCLIENVKANLGQWQIAVDDSSIFDLGHCALANYLFLISEFAGNFSLLNLLAILKNPLNQPDKFLPQFEIKIARGLVKFSSFEEMVLYAKTIDSELANYLQKLADIFAPLLREFSKEKADFKKILQTHFECSLALSGGFKETEGGEEFLEFYQELLADDVDFYLEPQSYGRLLRNLLKNYRFKKAGNFHPRLHVLSRIEARLMDYDLTIVADLCEGEFPAKNGDDWLGNKIRADFGLPSLAKHVGTSAYDFCNYLGSKELALIYPKNKNNSPTVKSRFLLKLEAVLKVAGLENILQDGEKYLRFLNAAQIEQNSAAQRSSPKPKQNLQKISATDISKWLRNPYYIYAKRILNLRPLKKIEQEASFAEFGNFVHKILENFVRDYQKIETSKRAATLLEDSKKNFGDYFPDHSSHILWWPRFENIIQWFLRREEILRQNLKESFVEVEAEMRLGNIILTTKIDRLNLYDDGSFEIIDYKTGQLPAPKEIKNGLEPQLAIEAMILHMGDVKNYSELKKIKIGKLQYQNLKGRDQNEFKDLKDAELLIDEAQKGMAKLLEIFVEQNSGYICCPDFDIYEEDDYHHLGRIGELL
ncbi:MAG: helicase [Rickettsiaceae bacterium]|jgi:ATP-dependent helicase/nuclease subunit B|nr:helicase [Rickettsiaceae bacterium]